MLPDRQLGILPVRPVKRYLVLCGYLCGPACMTDCLRNPDLALSLRSGDAQHPLAFGQTPCLVLRASHFLGSVH